VFHDGTEVYVVRTQTGTERFVVAGPDVTSKQFLDAAKPSVG